MTRESGSPISEKGRSYHQYCGLARALDHVGDRWTLLVIRELLVAARRYNDLLDGLPGIATNLLVARLKSLEGDGVIRRKLPETGSRGIYYELTDLGRDLEPAVIALTAWGGAWMTSGQEEDDFRGHWLLVAAKATLDPRPSDLSARLAIVGSDETVTITRDSRGLSGDIGSQARTDVTVAGPPDAIMGLLSGFASVGDLEPLGLRVSGSKTALKRVLGRRESPKSGETKPRFQMR